MKCYKIVRLLVIVQLDAQILVVLYMFRASYLTFTKNHCMIHGQQNVKLLDCCGRGCFLFVLVTQFN